MKNVVRKIMMFSNKLYFFKIIMPAGIIFLGVLLGVSFAQAPVTYNLDVMKTGLGEGTITSGTGINCGVNCYQNLPEGTAVTLNAVQQPGSTFTGWSGACTGMGTCNITMNSNKSARAEFTLDASIPALSACDTGSTCTPQAVATYLANNPQVNTPAKFLRALPDQYKFNYILMTRSESFQNGTAQHPRVILPSTNGRYIFSIALGSHPSYPGSHSNAIEFIQWDSAEKNFRFHEIVIANIPVINLESSGTYILAARTRGVTIDDEKCTLCHSTRNVYNRGSTPGTTGVPINSVKAKSKPNWDAYDSWGGMMPFNRDRVYGGSVEEAAYRHIFNLWNWRGSASNDAARQVIEQLELQPNNVTPQNTITRQDNNINDSDHLLFPFPFGEMGTTVLSPSINYFFGEPDDGSARTVPQRGNYVTLSNSFVQGDEGRGVQLFDAFTGFDDSMNRLNGERIADELVNHRWVTGSVRLDIRPLALAITRECIPESDVINNAGPLSAYYAFFNQRNGMSYNDVKADTLARAQSLPRRKANVQKKNLSRVNDPYTVPPRNMNGLIQEYGANTPDGLDTSHYRIRKEVFRRDITGFSGAVSIPPGNVYVDRESYGFNNRFVAMYRYFLEPLGVSVDKWSLSVRGRSRTYTFADVFSATYIPAITDGLTNSLTPGAMGAEPIAGLTDPTNCGQLITAVQNSFSSLPLAGDLPTYTDIQRIFNKACIDCHGGTMYPPYDVSYSGTLNPLDLSENADPAGGEDRLDRSYSKVMSYSAEYLLFRMEQTNEDCPGGMMPCEGPPLSKTDIETFRRWTNGGKPYTIGDPHIQTIQGINYDFQAAGEFTLLRGKGLEVQARQTPVVTDGPLGPNPYTGLTSCVSINTAVAVRMGPHRITYQPSIASIKPGKHVETLKKMPENSDRLELRLDGNLVSLSQGEILLPSGGRIFAAPQDGVQIEWPGGTTVIITPQYWSYYKVWYMSIDTKKVRATDGLMGTIRPGEWLPALSNGASSGSKPADLNQRYDVLYNKFGRSWQVTRANSLFDYAPGTSPATFMLSSWPKGESPGSCSLPETWQTGVVPKKALLAEEAQKACKDIISDDLRGHCIEDVKTIGEPELAVSYQRMEKLRLNREPERPELIFPENLAANLDTDLDFKWETASDPERDSVSYRLCLWDINEKFTLQKCDTAKIEVKWLSGGIGCAIAIIIILIVIFIVLVQRGIIPLNNKNIIIAVCVLLIMALLGLFAGGPRKAAKTVSNLKSGASYFWKILAIDENGAMSESITNRITIK